MKISLNGPGEWLLLLVICALLVTGPIQLRRHWKDEKSAFGDWYTSALWYKSDRFRRGHVRATPVVIALGLALCLFGLTLFIIPPVSEGNIDWPASVGLAILGACIVIAIPLYWSIMLFNRPRFLVAPHLRSQPGVLRDKDESNTP